ncbi:MAG: hypothetical protein UT92_C0013G0021 [Candidatus Curtissbacteria bacterium GW2011_GWA1_40_24]|uniref:Uncharacterized protein n=1 Tax=Candidatus Curtissbacteria bacterium GW2011_GWA1_40_24 TaxID=1618406 RepID=A0A0G0U5R5_9BACT|nr:MAG: hypothetical protein UT92_C0013G0021 [Candidatus Curtissbacteria bacterium GW2011_GWA1_40_24]
MGQKIILTSTLKGFLVAFLLLIFYFSIVTLISGWDFAQGQFFEYWYFILVLAVGFGIQVALYFYLRDISRQNISTKVLATTGTTSAAAMISCCSHYLVNILPVIGVAGFITLASQYQVQFFWIGIIANILGIAFIAAKIAKFSKSRRY